MLKLCRIMLALLVLGAVPAMTLAEDGTTQADKDEMKQLEEKAKIIPHGMVSAGTGFAVGGACIGAGLAAIGGGYAIAKVGGQCIESMARQPEAAGTMFAPMIVTAAMIEGAMLFAIAVALLGVLKIL